MDDSNFKDPFGLLKRMLFSGNKVAYSILTREVINRIVTPLDYLLQKKENAILKKSARNSSKPIILILGGSRSGTTLLYQTLAHYLPVSYINNFVASFNHSPISAQKLFNRLIPKPKKSFKNYYGSAAGMGGPNDAFFLWNRWLGHDRNHAPKDIDHQSKTEMRNFFDTWLSLTKKPFLNKNNRNSLCAPMLDSILENVFFVEIYRDPIFVAQSLVLSRRLVQGSENTGWGLLSKDTVESSDSLQYIDDICEQVYKVNKVIENGRSQIDPKKYIRVSYERFCENPHEVVQQIGLEAMNYRVNSEDLERLKFSTKSNNQRLNDDEYNRIINCMDRLYEPIKT